MSGIRTAVVSTLLIARTSSGGSSCDEMTIVEIFAGTEECPKAQYVVLRMDVDLQGRTRLTWVETGSGRLATFPDSDAVNNMMDDKLLVATAQAETLFGITADAVAPGDLYLDIPDGFVRYSCSGETVLYGAGGVAPGLMRGMALKKIGTNWVTGAPSPANNAGDPVVSGKCPPDPDAGVDPEPELDASAPDAEPSETDDDSGCGCRVSAAPPGEPWMALLAFAALAARRRS